MDSLLFNPLDDLNNEFEPEKEEVIIHIRNQQRNGRKSITIIENLDKYNEGKLDLQKICKFLRKTFKCSSSIEKTKDQDGNIIKQTFKLSGDVRLDVKKYLVGSNICDEKCIKMHGF